MIKRNLLSRMNTRAPFWHFWNPQSGFWGGLILVALSGLLLLWAGVITL